MKTVVGIVLALVLLAGALLWWQAPATWKVLHIAELHAEEAKARARVTTIVNQPVTHLARSDEAMVFSPGWFHEGAITPDFDHVDVRATQEFPYDRATYVTSDVTPTEMFLGQELEFNAMTKYFYVDRNLPKKRLSQAEMDEINQLYRTIGSDERAIAQQYRLLAMVAGGVIATVALLVAVARR